MTKLLLTRHGHVEGLHPERFRGRAELTLTPQGRAQAEALAARIARTWKPVLVYTSALQRGIVTGSIVAAAAGVKTLALDGLMDIDYGAWQMRSHEEVGAESPEAYRLWKAAPHRLRFPGGESLQDVAARTADVLRLTLERHPGDAVVLVGHDSVNRVVLLELLGLPLSAYWRLAQDPCTLNEIDVEGGEVRVRRINDTSHLD